jgi:MFS family permease
VVPVLNETQATAPVQAPPDRRRYGLATVLGVLAGIALAVLWSAQLVDDDIGVNVANGLVGGPAASTSLSSTATALLVAFVTGIAGTFTACNVAVFSAVAPLVEGESRGRRLRAAVRPLGLLALGAVLVAGVYGAVGALLGPRIPQLSTATVGSEHLPVRLIQSMVVFGVIGLVMLWLGLAAARLVPDPLGPVSRRFPGAPRLVMGMLIGGFLIGRPWPLFQRMFQHAAATHNAAFGAGTFVLITLGNLLLMAVLFLLLALSPFPAWLRRQPSRTARLATVALCAGGMFTLVYWVVRLPAGFGIGWFPVMPWNS